jgi:hypothetical protein
LSARPRSLATQGSVGTPTTQRTRTQLPPTPEIAAEENEDGEVNLGRTQLDTDIASTKWFLFVLLGGLVLIIAYLYA